MKKKTVRNVTLVITALAAAVATAAMLVHIFRIPRRR